MDTTKYDPRTIVPQDSQWYPRVLDACGKVQPDGRPVVVGQVHVGDKIAGELSLVRHSHQSGILMMYSSGGRAMTMVESAVDRMLTMGATLA